MMIDHILLAMLAAAVPLVIMEMREGGGPSQEDWNRARAFGKRLGFRGDVLLYGGAGTADLANECAHALAVLAFCPGGITFAEMHFEATL